MMLESRQVRCPLQRKHLLIRVVIDFTVCSATCFALWPALIAESESENRDLSDGVDHPRFQFVIVEQGCKVFQMIKYVHICIFVQVYCIVLHLWLELSFYHSPGQIHWVDAG